MSIILYLYDSFVLSTINHNTFTQLIQRILKLQKSMWSLSHSPEKLKHVSLKIAQIEMFQMEKSEKIFQKSFF